MSKAALSKSVQAFAAWHKLVRLLVLLQILVFVLATAFAGFVLVDRLVYTGTDCGLVGLCLAAGGLLVLLAAYLAMNRRLAEVTYLIDHNAGLKNLVTSGLAVAAQPEPIAQVVAARAAVALQQHDMRKVLPLRWHWTGRFSFIPVLLAAGLFFLPSQDLFSRKARRDEKVRETTRREQGARILKDKLVKIEQINRQVSQMDGKNISEDLKKLEQELRAAAGKKEALTSLSSLENRYRKELDKQRNFEDATKSLATRLNSQDLNTKTAEELRKLLENLKRDSLSQAASNMRELAQQLGSNELSEKEKEAMVRELSQVMQQFAGDPQADELSKLLSQMQGKPLNQQTAASPNNPSANPANPANPAGRQKPNQQNPNQQNAAQQQNPNQQNTAQQQNLDANPQTNPNAQQSNCNSGQGAAGSQGQAGSPQDKAQAQQQASGQMQQLAESLDQMAALKQMKEGLDSARREMMGEEFAGFDAKNVEEYLRQEQGSGACLGMPGEGEGEGGKGNGPGTGGEGRGRGGRPPEQMTPTGFEDKLTQSKVGKGSIINQRWVQGVPDKGDAVNDYSSAVRAARDQALDSLAKTRVPREYEEQVKRYFSSLEPEKGKDRQE